MDAAGVRERLREIVSEAGVADPALLAETSAAAQGLVRSAGVPEALRTTIVDAYRRLGDDVAVAVRSSATSEDTAGTSFAGMNETFTNVVGPDAHRSDRRLLGVGVRPARRGLP